MQYLAQRRIVVDLWSRPALHLVVVVWLLTQCSTEEQDTTLTGFVQHNCTWPNGTLQSLHIYMYTNESNEPCDIFESGIACLRTLKNLNYLQGLCVSVLSTVSVCLVNPTKTFRICCVAIQSGPVYNVCTPYPLPPATKPTPPTTGPTSSLPTTADTTVTSAIATSASDPENATMRTIPNEDICGKGCTIGIGSVIGSLCATVLVVACIICIIKCFGCTLRQKFDLDRPQAEEPHPKAEEGQTSEERSDPQVMQEREKRSPPYVSNSRIMPFDEQSRMNEQQMNPILNPSHFSCQMETPSTYDVSVSTPSTNTVTVCSIELTGGNEHAYPDGNLADSKDLAGSDAP